MKANAATLPVRHVERSASHGVLRGPGVSRQAENLTGLLILCWILGWALVLSLAVIALAGVSMSAGRQAAAVPDVWRPADSVMVPDPAAPVHTEDDIYYAP